MFVALPILEQTHISFIRNCSLEIYVLVWDRYAFVSLGVVKDALLRLTSNKGPEEELSPRI